MFFISQLGEQDCAFACLKMLLANYHKDKNYLYLPCENKSYSFQDLINIAKEHSLELTGVKINDLEELFKCRDFPLIVTLNKKKGVKHSVLLLNANTKYVNVYDPSLGKRKIHTEVFIKEWTFKALVITGGEIKKCPKAFPDFISKKDKITLPVLQILSGLSLIIGVYFLSKETHFVIPVALLSLFFIFELMFRCELINASKRMDDNIAEFKIREGVKYRELFNNIERYRTLALKNIPNFIYSCLIVMFMVIVLVMNSLIYSIYALVALAISLLEVFIYNPYFRNKSVILEEKESELDEVENDFQYKMKSGEIHSLTYHLALSRNLYFYAEIAVILLSIILTMVFSGVINITFVVFFLCVSIFLKENFTRIIEYTNQSVELDFTRAKLINSITEIDNIS